MPLTRQDQPISDKTIRRDISNKETAKQVLRIPKWRLEFYARWLYEKAEMEPEWIAKWLEYSDYEPIDEILAGLNEKLESFGNIRAAVKSNVPNIEGYLCGPFLGRENEITELTHWADQRRHPIALLWGFGGNGKTLIQLKVGRSFVRGQECPLLWPYEGAVWISALQYQEHRIGLLDVLREVARTFEILDNHVGLEQAHPDWIMTATKHLLEERRILVLIDNFEIVDRYDQLEILHFFNYIRGFSQVLISSRYYLFDHLLDPDGYSTYTTAHVLIRVEGLSPEHARALMHYFIETRSLPERSFTSEDLDELAEITQNNPKVILAMLGLIERGMMLPLLLQDMKAGNHEADKIFDLVIHRACREMLTPREKAVLMAKAFFSRTVTERDLGMVAGVGGATVPGNGADGAPCRKAGACQRLGGKRREPAAADVPDA